MKTVDGLKRVDVVYRRIDDDFLDPRVLIHNQLLVFRGSWMFIK